MWYHLEPEGDGPSAAGALAYELSRGPWGRYRKAEVIPRKQRTLAEEITEAHSSAPSRMLLLLFGGGEPLALDAKQITDALSAENSAVYYYAEDLQKRGLVRVDLQAYPRVYRLTDRGMRVAGEISAGRK